MNLIVYGTKYGSAEKCVDKLLGALKDPTDVCNIQKMSGIDLGKYDTVIIGGSIYMGNIQKEIKTFCSQNLEVLKSKKIALFICCMQTGENAYKQLENAYPKELIEVAKDKKVFGGEINTKKLGFFDRFITKMVSKASNSGLPSLDKEGKASLILHDNIEHLASAVNS
ncbi:menaquinone-dependent protoporphyrinogen oxidase [Natranaerovirga pectinivora]|uniref:Menaquinone-dependent protoporphyrinogen oxidase n=1 Tax=Natranaerovirga pectinivora TaxID=682400 RepID=A0A4R3MKZ4_9FIRM|nr:flavodoxin domain-containing protein [Natranaerovirga pectinivora]TCT15376.1 menaquinone-dependent protoporphyrinogen oxidase [Natranaerovirga pectinivora]